MDGLQFLLDQMDGIYHLGVLAGTIGLWNLQEFFFVQAEDIETALDEWQDDIRRLGAELVRVPGLVPPRLQGLTSLGPQGSPVAQSG